MPYLCPKCVDLDNMIVLTEDCWSPPFGSNRISSSSFPNKILLSSSNSPLYSPKSRFRHESSTRVEFLARINLNILRTGVLDGMYSDVSRLWNTFVYMSGELRYSVFR